MSEKAADDLVEVMAGAIGYALATHGEGADLSDAPLEEASRAALQALSEAGYVVVPKRVTVGAAAPHEAERQFAAILRDCGGMIHET